MSDNVMSEPAKENSSVKLTPTKTPPKTLKDTEKSSTAQTPEEYKLHLTKILQALKSLTDDLWSVYGDPKEASSLALYRRLLTRTIEVVNETVSDANYIPNVQAVRFLQGLHEFDSTYDKLLLEGQIKTIPENAKLKYSNSTKVYLEIGKFIRSADEEDVLVLEQHLLVLSALLNTTEDKLKKLENPKSKAKSKPVVTSTSNVNVGTPKIEDVKDLIVKSGIDTSTKEGEIINNMMTSALTSIENLKDKVDMNANPLEGMMSLVQGGIIPNLLQNLQQGASKGEINPMKFFTCVQSLMTNMAPMIQNMAGDGTVQNTEKTEEQKREEAIEKDLLNLK